MSFFETNLASLADVDGAVYFTESTGVVLKELDALFGPCDPKTYESLKQYDAENELGYADHLDDWNQQGLI